MNPFKRIVLTGLLVLTAFFALGCAHRGAAPDPGAHSDHWQDSPALLEITQYIDDENWPLAKPAIDSFLDSGEMERLPPATRQSVLATAGWTSVYLEQLPQAKGYFTQALQLHPSPAILGVLAQIEFQLGNKQAAAALVGQLVGQWPEDVQELPAHLVFNLGLRASLPAGDRLAYLQALFDAHLDRREPEAGRFWIDLALALIENGELEKARIVVDRIERPQEIVILRSNRRFDAVIDREASRWQADKKAVDYVNRLFDLLRSDDASGQQLTELGVAMRVAGMHTQLVELGEVLLTSADAEALLDQDDARVWLLDNLALAADVLGDVDQAQQALRRASQLPELGQENVSLRLNLGNYLCRIGKADEALASMESIGPVSAFGRMVQVSIKLCAALTRKDDTAAKQALDYLRENQLEAPILTLNAMLDAGLMDEAEALLHELLTDPERRTEVLSWVQDYLPTPVRPGDVAVVTNRAVLLGRPDVRIAIDAVGRLESHNIYAAEGL